MELIMAIRKLQADKPAIVRANQMGHMSTEVWQGLVQAEQFVMEEIEEVKAEADALKEGWGEQIFPQAGQMLQRQQAAAMEAHMQAERARQAEQQKREALRNAADAKRREETDAKKRARAAAAMEAQLIKEEEQQKAAAKAKKANKK